MAARRFRSCFFLSLLVWPFGPAPAADEQTAYRVLPGESVLEILVFRAGALARLGHNHVITSNGITGSVVVGESPADSSLELSLPVESLTVDDPEERAEAGAAFESEVSDEDRQGTRENMLSEKLLDADRYEEVRIVSQRISGEFSDMSVHAQIEIRGATHEIDLPVSVALYGDRLVATGRTDISHAELGLSPFTAGFGALRVSEDMMFRYRIVAVRP